MQSTLQGLDSSGSLLGCLVRQSPMLEKTCMQSRTMVLICGTSSQYVQSGCACAHYLALPLSCNLQDLHNLSHSMHACTERARHMVLTREAISRHALKGLSPRGM